MFLSVLSPREIVVGARCFIVGQGGGRRKGRSGGDRFAAIAGPAAGNCPTACAKRWQPKNILMIPDRPASARRRFSRRLAEAAGGRPFLKVEATKFTEVGYVRAATSSRSCATCSRSAFRNCASGAGAKCKGARCAQGRRRSVSSTHWSERDSSEANTRVVPAQAACRRAQRQKEIEVQVADGRRDAGVPTFPGMPGAQIGMVNLFRHAGEKAFGQAAGKAREDEGRRCPWTR